ncbi:uncharacterized protein mslna [Siphateles boraxobius]|uniref:uncharacterized protein mslna n=1 Tax=Siphateles boraxobius TaxID=180520 RepID=UPI004062C35D
MANFQLSVLFVLGFVTLIKGECVVDFQNGTVSNTGSTCSLFSNATFNNILTCSGIQLSDVSQENLSNLKAFTDSAFNLYTLLRSRLNVSLVVSSINDSRSNGTIVGALSDVGFARLWFQVNLSPYLSSLSRETLFCLSQSSSLNCQSFHALVQDLSSHIGSERQRMVYQNFIKPFLTRNTSDAGCVNSTNSNTEWFVQNFQTFSASASLGDFTALKKDFNGLDVVDKLSPEQKAELIFQLKATGNLNTDAINKIFQSFLQPLTDITLNITSVTSVGLNKNLTDFLVDLRPLGRFIRSSVAIAQTTDASTRTAMINLVLNWTQSFVASQATTTFNITNITEWFQIVVIPALKKNLQNQTLPDSVIESFVFAPEPQIADPVDICKVTSNNSSCLILQTGQSLAKVINCVAQSNLSFTEENLRLLITELSRPLQTQVTNSSQSNLTALFAELPAENFTPGNLEDAEFMRFWFQIKMKPLLPKISREFLSCLATRSFSCQAYNALFVEINNNFGVMNNATQRWVLNDFIVPFLSQRQNTSVDCTLPFNNSSDFILQNFGNFFPLAQLQVISKLSRNFSALEVLSHLTPVQLNELVFSPPASPADRTNILTRVFDFLLQASNRDKLNNFLPSLQTQARKANFSCENYKIFFDKMDQTLSSVPSNQSEALLTIRDAVMMIPPDECIERADQCTTTPVNESSLCASVNSSALDQFLKVAAPNATAPLCNFTVLQFACLPMLSQLNSQQVADVLTCKLASNVGKEIWKLFFTKTSTNLDDALLKLSNMTLSPSNVSLSDVLEVLVDVRVDRFSPQRLRDPLFIRSWFQGRLKPFLPSVSQRVLSCLSNKNLTCESYRTIFVEINNNFGVMNNATQRWVLNDFIVPFLSQRQNTSVDCTLPFNNSSDFILQNFGNFFPLAQLQVISKLSRNFSALEVLSHLTPVQLNELVFSPPASPADRTNILTRVFDFLLQASNRDKLNNFLPSLQTQARKANFSCENYKIFFDKMDQTLSSVPSNQSEALLTIRDAVMMIPPDECIERADQCTTTPVNESSLCASVNSSALDQFLKVAAPNATAPLCNFTVLQFACLPMLSQLNSQQVADVLTCKLASNVGKEIWKLFFTKTSTNLDDALLKLSNMTLSPSNVSLSDVLEVLVDVRVDRFSPQRLRDPLFIRSWFQGRLKPFLPSVSQRVLSCLSNKNLTCESYRTIFVEINNNFGVMNNATQRWVLNDFIVPFLSQRQNTSVDCTLPFNNSSDFILQNFGNFFPLAQLQVISKLSRNFSALEVLSHLTPVQLNELVFSPPASPADRTNILTRVFDFLLQASNRDKLNNFLPSLQTQARKANFSCENYKIFFDKMDQTLSSVPSNQSEALLTIRDAVMMIPPDECIERAGQCTTTPVNESSLCASVNSSALDQFLKVAAPNATAPLCNFTVLQFACLPMLSQLNSQQVADVLACKLASNVGKEIWKLFFTKTSTNLDDALLKLSNMTLSPSNVSLSDVLEVLVDVRVDRFSPQRLRDPLFIRSWFQGRLKPFLPSVSQRVLSCLSNKNLTCESYRTITEAFVNAPLRDGQDVCYPLQPNATQRQDLVYKEFMKAFLSRNDTDDPRCLRNSTNSTQWINRNFGPFVQSAPLTDLAELNRNFTAVDILPLLGLKQLVEFSVTPGALKDPPSVISVMQFVKDCQLSAFFDLLSKKVEGARLTQDVNAVLIRQIFDRANLSNINVTNQEVLVWFQDRLKPLLANLSESVVSPFFTLLSARDCNITQSALGLLNVSSIPTNTKNAIYNSILLSFRGPQPLRCYRNNSFITFLNESLFGFGPLPNLTTFLSLIPQPRKSELINSASPYELGSYLRQLEVVNNDSQICVIFNNFVRTPDFLDTEDVPDNLKSAILPCVWPLALTSNNQTEIDLWFNRRLRLYLKFLNKDILGSKDTLNASCLSYRKMVNVLGNNFTFNGSQISSADVYTTIKTYLKADTAPKCYSQSDATLNSTAWFVNHIGMFITSLSLDDLYSFGSESTIKTFAVNPENIKLFNQKTLPKNVLSRYTELIFLQNPNFSLFDLPPVLQCDAPVSTFTALNESQTSIILNNFKSSCSNVDPAISTALAGNIKTINANAISNLGNEVVGLTTVQLNSAPPSVLISGLSTLSNVSGWSFGQAQAIIKVLISGSFQFNNSGSLLNIGSLIGGIPSTVLALIQPQEILSTSKNREFVKNILSAPDIVQKTFVTQIIKVGSTPADLVANIPDNMAVQIPRNFVTIPSDLNVTVVRQFNNKKWKPEQAVLFFDTVANSFDQPDELSVDVLQGFTCSRVQKFPPIKTRGLIRACRRRAGRSKVALSETQLTCMYNLVRSESTVDFASYPPDMLLYYNYETINKTFCKAYFAEVGAADLSVFSSTLSRRRDILWNNALDCFGIKGKSIQKQDLAVLGNLACAASADVIKNSDPEILENLKNCNDLSNVQISAMEDALMKGTSKYGQQSSWNQKTLSDLGILPLYFSQTFWRSFNQNDLSKFLKTFLKFVRVRKTPKPQLKILFRALIRPISVKRAAGSCTVGSITSVTLSDDAFPTGYDDTQFNNCLDATVVRDNLASLCEKIEDSAFQRIILDKLNLISPNGLSDDQVQVLKSVSRSATADEISKWNITKADTLAALMNPDDGEWSPALSKQIITKYLSANNNLTDTELNAVRGPNLCSLNANTLSAILPESLRLADNLDVSQCSSDNKKALFTIANKAFPILSVNQSGILSVFQLIESFLGGADLGYIKNLTTYNISMSLATFKNLDVNVILNLSVSEVVGLLGPVNLQDLRTFENETVVRSWISLQVQSDLDKLGLGLTGGKSGETTVAPTVKATAATTVGAGAPGIGRSGWSVSLSILVLIFTIIKVEIIY